MGGDGVFAFTSCPLGDDALEILWTSIHYLGGVYLPSNRRLLGDTPRVAAGKFKQNFKVKM
jgi:hypothetical protein